MNIAHIIFATIFGLFFLIAIRYLSKRGRLTMRYTLGWLLIGFFVLGYPVFVKLTELTVDVIADCITRVGPNS